MPTKRIKNGKWEYTIKRKAKDILWSRSYPLEKEKEGDAEIARIEALIDAGHIPDFVRKKEGVINTIGELIREYLTKVAVGESDRPLLGVLSGRVGEVKLTSVNYQWVEQWIRDMKVKLNLAPGTIRHHVGALGRCFDWAGRMDIAFLAVNPIRQLPKNYAQYNAHDSAATKVYDEEHEPQEDQSRDRRFMQGEEARIRAILNGEKPEGRQRPLELRYQAALEFFFVLALESGMRMKEMFTLTLDQVKVDQKTISLIKTKNGNRRQVPMTTVALAKYHEYVAHVNAQTRGMKGFNFFSSQQLLFPWWSGKKEDLKRTTALLSRQYARIFDAAGCEDLNFHDLRHEATSRFFENSPLQEFEIMLITGHSSTRMLKRYANIRANKFVDKLW